MARVKQEVGLERMITLASNADAHVRAVAAESIGEEVWRDPKKRERARQLGAIDALLAMCFNRKEQKESVLPAIWSLRNLVTGDG